MRRGASAPVLRPRAARARARRPSRSAAAARPSARARAAPGASGGSAASAVALAAARAGAGAAAGTASGAGFDGAAGAGAAAVPAGVAGAGTDDGKTNGELYAARRRRPVRRARRPRAIIDACRRPSARLPLRRPPVAAVAATAAVARAARRPVALPAADADAAVLGVQLDRRARARRRHPADGDDVPALVLRAADPGAVRVAASAARLADRPPPLAHAGCSWARSASARTTRWPTSASTTRRRPTASS